VSANGVVTGRDGPVATVELARPERLNPLDEPTRHALLTALRAADDDADVRAIVLTGAGRAFCVGQDLAAVDELTDAHDTVARTYNPLIRALRGAGKPVVAAVNGPAVGAGMGLALACDLVVMAESASLSCAFGRMALVPDTGTAWFLTRRLGQQRAFELATSGRRIGAAEALALGLANEVVPDAELRAKAAALAAELAAGPGTAFALTKRLLVTAADTDLSTVLEQEALAQGVAAATDEHLRRRTAFLERSH
jgi:2-(1,2-epoxy-1,2-dihydrophenyl)acetyl-CoA isomerase